MKKKKLLQIGLAQVCLTVLTQSADASKQKSLMEQVTGGWPSMTKMVQSMNQEYNDTKAVKHKTKEWLKYSGRQLVKGGCPSEFAVEMLSPSTNKAIDDFPSVWEKMDEYGSDYHGIEFSNRDQKISAGETALRCFGPKQIQQGRLLHGVRTATNKTKLRSPLNENDELKHLLGTALTSLATDTSWELTALVNSASAENINSFVGTVLASPNTPLAQMNVANELVPIYNFVRSHKKTAGSLAILITVGLYKSLREDREELTNQLIGHMMRLSGWQKLGRMIKNGHDNAELINAMTLKGSVGSLVYTKKKEIREPKLSSELPENTSGREVVSHVEQEADLLAALQRILSDKEIAVNDTLESELKQIKKILKAAAGLESALDAESEQNEEEETDSDVITHLKTIKEQFDNSSYVPASMLKKCLDQKGGEKGRVSNIKGLIKAIRSNCEEMQRKLKLASDFAENIGQSQLTPKGWETEKFEQLLLLLCKYGGHFSELKELTDQLDGTLSEQIKAATEFLKFIRNFSSNGGTIDTPSGYKEENGQTSSTNNMNQLETLKKLEKWLVEISKSLGNQEAEQTYFEDLDLQKNAWSGDLLAVVSLWLKYSSSSTGVGLMIKGHLASMGADVLTAHVAEEYGDVLGQLENSEEVTSLSEVLNLGTRGLSSLEGQVPAALSRFLSTLSGLLESSQLSPLEGEKNSSPEGTSEVIMDFLKDGLAAYANHEYQGIDSLAEDTAVATEFAARRLVSSIELNKSGNEVENVKKELLNLSALLLLQSRISETRKQLKDIPVQIEEEEEEFNEIERPGQNEEEEDINLNDPEEDEIERPNQNEEEEEKGEANVDDQIPNDGQ